MAITFDPSKRDAALIDRALDFEAAALVFAGPCFSFEDDRHAYGETRIITIGMLAGRTVVVDEAFMDAVPTEAQSLADVLLPGLVVLRSLTKTWGIAGLRAGYAVGDEPVIAAMRAQQPPWSVSTPALAAIAACLQPEALAEAAAATRTIAAHREVLVAGLAELGLPAAGRPSTPFVLVDTGRIGRDGSVRTILREHGFAVRRGDTFPGLGPDWIRIAVREPAVSRRLLETLATLGAAAGSDRPAVLAGSGAVREVRR